MADEEFWQDDAQLIAAKEREQREYERTGMRMPVAASAPLRTENAQRRPISVRQQPTKLTTKASIIIGAIGLGVGVFIAWLYVPPLPVVTLAEFEQLSEGMTPDQCNDIVGRDGATVLQVSFPHMQSIPQDLKNIQWRNHDGTNAVAGFLGGKLYCKVQIGLR
jgi:hypothetical protein